MILSNISVKADFPGQDESHTDNLTVKTTSSNKMARHTLPAALVPGTEHVSAVRKHEFSDTGSRTGWRDLTSLRSHDKGPRGSHLRVLFKSPVKFWVRINTNSSYCYHQECDMRIAAMSAHRDSKSGYYKSGSGAWPLLPSCRQWSSGTKVRGNPGSVAALCLLCPRDSMPRLLATVPTWG